MKVRILMALRDNDYLERLSRVMSEKYASLLEITACSSTDSMQKLLQHDHVDVALVDPELAGALDMSAVKMPILLWDGVTDIPALEENPRIIRKYQRISAITAAVLEHYATLPSNDPVLEDGAEIVAVWSPAGGCGKTTAALAYAAQAASRGEKAIYLDLEPFSSVDAYFTANGKSISSVFERLDANPELLLQSVQQEDSSSGICFFNKPDNYDDMNELTGDDIRTLVNACARICDTLVVDYSGDCNERARVLFAAAQKVLIVVDNGAAAQKKWAQFCRQHSVFESIREKTVLVKNRGAAKIPDNGASGTVLLPVVQSADPSVVYKTLSSGYFA